MSEEDWEVVEIVSGELQAEILGGLLEAQGVPIRLSREGIGRVYGLGVGPLAEVQILVPVYLVKRAKQVLTEYYAGDFQLGDEDETGEESNGDPNPDELHG
ncbi:MAG TPA: hypothetical protein VF823_12175 [Anaerolineales bacterium]